MALKASDVERLLSDGATLRGQHLGRARLKGINLSGQDLTDADLSGANLADADLSGCQLAGANLSGARLTGTNLSGAVLSGANLLRARLKGADLSNADLSRAMLSRLSLNEVTLTGASFKDADLSEADLGGCRGEGVNFDGALLSRATLDGATFTHCSFVSATLDEAYLEKINLDHVDLSDAKLLRANMVQCVLVSPTLNGTVLKETDLAEATIRSAHLLEVDLTDAILDQARLIDVTFEGGSVKGADLQGVTGLDEATLEALQVRGAVVRALALSRLLDSVLGSRFVRRGLVAGLAVGIGFFFYYYTRPAEQPLDAVLEQAQALRQADEHDKALSLYDTLLAAAKPGSESAVQLQYLRAETLMELDRAAEASEVFKSLANGEHENKDEAINARLRLVSVQVEQGAYDEAIPSLQAIAEDPDAAPADVARALIALSSVYDRMGFSDKAIEVAEQALTRYPDRPVVALEVNRHIADLLVERQDFARAQALLNELEDFVHDDSERAELLMSRAHLYEEMGDQNRALEVMAKLLSEFPDNPEVSPEVRFELAQLLAERGDVEQAQRILQGLMAESRGRSLYYMAAVALARLDAEVGRNLKALEMLQGLGDDPNMQPEDRGLAHMAEAEILSRLGKRTEALEILNQMVSTEEAGQIGPAFLMKAQNLVELGELVEAEKTYNQILNRFASVPDMTAAARMGLAMIMEKQLRWDDAERLYATILKTTSGPDERSHAYERLGAAQLARGDSAAARATWEKMQSELPAGEGQARARFGLAELAAASGDLDLAVKLYREAADETQDPSIRAIALQNLAQLYMQRGLEPDARLVYQEIVDRVPPGHEAAFTARMGLANLYARHLEIEPALKLYRAAIDATARAAQQAEGLLAVGLLQLDVGRLEDAKATFTQITERYASRPEALDEARLGLARVSEATGEVSQAMDLYRAVAEQSEEPSTVSAALSALAGLLEAQGKTAEALAIQRQILKRFGDDPETSFQAHLAAANAKVNGGDVASATVELEQLLSTTTDAGLRALVLDGLAKAQHQAGDLEAAARTYEALAKVSADNPDFYHNALMGLASLKVLLGDAAAGRALYTQVAEQSPDKGLKAWALEALAQLEAEAGNQEQAEAMYEAILSRFKDDPTVTAGTRLSLGQLRRSNDDLEGAAELFSEVAQTARDGSQRGWATLYLGQTRFEQGKHEQALEVLMGLIAEHPEDPEVLLNAHLSLASLYRARGKAEEATRVYQEVAEGNGFVDYRVSALEGLAGVAMDAGDTAQAKAAYDTILKRFGTQPEAAFNARLGLARLDASAGVEGAQRAATQLEALLPTAQDPVLRAWALQTLAQTYARLGDTDKAKASYRQLLADDGGLAELSQEARSFLDSM